MSEQMFTKGDVVYRMDGRVITRHVVTRTTATLACILAYGSKEEKFSQRNGHRIPRGSGYTFVRIEPASTEIEARYRASHRRTVAASLSYAAQQFERGDDAQAERITSLYTEWADLAAEPDDAGSV